MGGWHAGTGKPGRRPVVPGAGGGRSVCHPRSPGWGPRHGARHISTGVTGAVAGPAGGEAAVYVANRGGVTVSCPGSRPMPSAVGRLPRWRSQDGGGARGLPAQRPNRRRGVRDAAKHHDARRGIGDAFEGAGIDRDARRGKATGTEEPYGNQDRNDGEPASWTNHSPPTEWDVCFIPETRVVSSGDGRHPVPGTRYP